MPSSSLSERTLPADNIKLAHEPSPGPDGLSLQLVDAVCAQWGTAPDEGRLVWARIAA